MMLCRAAWQRLAPLARKTVFPLCNNAVSVRQMSFGLPASGTNIAYMVLGGGSLTAALVYAYKTINSDSERYNDRIAQMESRSKSEEGAVTAVTAAAEVEAAAAEPTAAAEAAAVEPVSKVFAAEPATAAADAPAEPAAAASVEFEVAVTTPAVEEKVTPVAEDVAADAAATVAEVTAIPMSDLLSTVKIIAGSTAEIAAASIGDQQLLAAVRLAEEKTSVENLNGVEVPDVQAAVPEEAEKSVSEVSEEVVEEETRFGGSDAEKMKNEEEELEELPSAPAAEEAADYAETEAENLVEAEVAAEDPVSLEAASEELTVDGEIMKDLGMEMAVSSGVVLSEPDTISGVTEVTSETAMEETAVSEDITEPSAVLEEALQNTRDAEGDVDVTKTKLDALE